ncbi:polyphosphate kinase 1 [Photobacterium profundum]|uniref:Polyphosphate kinase n=1 Tax=Photobacterium profundum 3TCK TaxID=314280 RepID=Q1YX84_9GAMM|nr:polyphosphate kinase 1 [Photobacterium profundum]EAS40877.1 polyphosphate kinase [Photobacterium profundum 3TCK]PSV64770.1 polyphosphate kinase 1 [Photobacterium profundum]
MSTESLYIEKELSWLSFNERVLQEAADKSVPLIERVRFLGIFSSNTDEFYKVRFADIKRRILINQVQGGDDGAKHLLSKIQSRVLKMNQDFDTLYNEILLEMARRHIFLVNDLQLDEHQQNWLRRYFRDSILPHITPILLTDDIDLLQFLKDEYSYLAIEMQQGEKKCHALIEIPTDQLPRFIELPEPKGKRKKTLILLDNIIRFCLDDIFNGFFEYDSLTAYSMKMTRDAEYDLSQEVEHGLLEQMSEGLNQRITAMPVRFVYQRDMPGNMIDVLCGLLKVSRYDSIIPGGRYHNFKDFIGFPNVGRKYLENTSLPPIQSYHFTRARNAFDAIKTQDILLYYPYHTFSHVTEFIRQASYDPKVRSIKINIYRVAKHSRVIDSMIDAANNGKRVTVVVELQARFDEEANIEWAKQLTEAGVHVVFGVPGLKIHSKLCLITRQEDDKLIRYAHIGTGNFNEKTARIYTDFSLLTCNTEIADEVRQVFSYIQNPYRPVEFTHLIVSPRNSRNRLYDLIDREIAHAKQNLPSGITLKVNNLVDKGLINMLYQASNNGVNIKLIVRGMCALIPGLKGISENITAISIIDRFLEHPRVAVFNNNNDPDVMISSADWMTRNIDHRIEVGCLINDPALKKKIIDILNIQLTDTVKARILDKDMSNQYVPRGNRRKIRSQIAIYDYLKHSEKQLKKRAEKAIIKNDTY